MGDANVDGKCKMMSACSSAKLFLFMVPLVVVSGFLFVNPTSFLTSLSTNQISPPLPSYPSLPPAAPSPSPPTSSLSTNAESIQVREITQEYQIIPFLFLHLPISACLFFLVCLLKIFIYLFSNSTLPTNICFKFYVSKSGSNYRQLFIILC